MLFKVTKRNINENELLRFEEDLNNHLKETNSFLNYDDLDYFIELTTEVHNLCRFDKLRGLYSEIIIASDDIRTIVGLTLNYEVDRGILNHLSLTSIHGDVSDLDYEKGIITPKHAIDVVNSFDSRSIAGDRLVDDFKDMIFKYNSYNFQKSTNLGAGLYVDSLELYNSNQTHFVGIKHSPINICDRIRRNLKHEVLPIKIKDNNDLIIH